MAVNLNPGADATIATAAARAGAALAPTDYGKAFRDYSSQYADAMQTIGTAKAQMIAAVGLKVADIKKRWNTIQDNVGDAVSDTIFNDMKGLANERKDMALGFSGSYDENGNWVRGEKFKNLDDVSRSQAKMNWKKKKKARFRTLRDIEDGRLLLGKAFSGKDIDKNALTTSQLVQVEGIINGGEPIAEGPAKGVRAHTQLDEKGEYYEYRFYGPDGQEVLGFNDDGSPYYESRGRGLTEKAEINTGSIREAEFLEDYPALKPGVRENMMMLMRNPSYGELSVEDGGMSKDDFQNMQFALKEMGFDFTYDVDYKDKDKESGYSQEWDDEVKAAIEGLRQREGESDVKRSETAGELWSEISTMGDKPISLSPSDIPGLFTTKDLKAQEDTNTIGLNSGLNKGLTTDLPFDEGQVRQDLDNVIDNSDNPDNTLRHLMHSDVLGMDESFADHLTNSNAFTDEMWAEIERLAGLGLIQNTGGELGEDGEPEYTEEDFKPSDVANFKALRNAMLDTNNAQSREIFTNFLTNGVRDKFDQGRSTREAERARQSASNTSTTGTDDGVDGFYTSNALWNNQQVPITGREKLKRRKSIIERETVGGKFGTYKWNDDTQMYMEYNFEDEEVGELTPYGVAQKELAVRSNETRDHKDFQTTLDAGGDDGAPGEITGGTEWRAINVDNDDDAAKNLNDHFAGTDFSENYKFVPQYGFMQAGPSIVTPDNPFSNDIMLVSVITGDPVVVNGKTLRFKTGMLEEKELRKIMDEINSTNILQPYIEQKRRILLDKKATSKGGVGSQYNKP